MSRNGAGITLPLPAVRPSMERVCAWKEDLAGKNYQRGGEGALWPHRGPCSEAGFHQEQAEAGVGGLPAERPLAWGQDRQIQLGGAHHPCSGPEKLAFPLLNQSPEAVQRYRGDHKARPFPPPETQQGHTSDRQSAQRHRWQMGSWMAQPGGAGVIQEPRQRPP